VKVDVLVLGGGIDGLACAALLAKSGRRVALCEARGRLGGIAAGEELDGGARTAGDGLAWAPPLGLLDALELERHGLAWRAEPPPLLVADGADRGLLVHADPARMTAALGGLAAARYAAFRGRLARWAPAVRALLFDVPPDLRLLQAGSAPLARRAADGLDLARKAFGLRRLGARDLSELLRTAPTAVRDLFQDELEGERLRAGLAVAALAGTTLGPRAPGTAATFLLDALGAGPEPVGGPPALVDALVSSARAHGVALHTSARGARLSVEDGQVRGAVVSGGPQEDGERRFEAPLVVSTLDFAATVLDLVDPAAAPAALERAAAAFKRRGRVAVVHLALAAEPAFPAAPGVAVERASSATSLDALERAADAAKHGRFAAHPWAELRVVRGAPSSSGACAVTLHVHACPERADDDATRRAALDAARAILARLAPDARVLGARAKLPADLAREHGLAGGHLHGGELILDQLWVQRPALAASRYRTALPGLWLGGPSSHPGGGLPGGAGVLAARAILAGS
jgi:phytoene dehydrogenase-like protein